ncbi:MAG: hypothetical protein NT071_09070, partial [Burkholderiales bacterium]|nr:hypothetical protein [Burkholderiales bacterium]
SRPERRADPVGGQHGLIGRTTFHHFPPPERILEVDCRGLTTTNLKSLPWRYLPRPIFPIDDHTTWSP